MTVRRIFVPVRGDGKGENVLDHAVMLGRRFNAHIEVIHCRAQPEDLLPYGVVVPLFVRKQIEEATTNLQNTEEDRLHELFNQYADSHGIEVTKSARERTRQLTMSWHEERGKMAAVVGRNGRLADIVVIARPDLERGIGRNTLESALMGTGRLVLMCPPEPAGTVAGHIAIAWNGSLESSRALALALPLLGAADKVTILSAGGGMPEALDAENLCDYLTDHSVGTVEVHEFKEGNNIGATLLSSAASVGADALLMGAYGKSKGREMVLGGATQHIVDHAGLPVFLAH